MCETFGYNQMNRSASHYWEEFDATSVKKCHLDNIKSRNKAHDHLFKNIDRQTIEQLETTVNMILCHICKPIFRFFEF